MSSSNFWTGGDTAGNDGSNWSLGHVPITGEVASFDDRTVIDCIFSSGITCDGVYAPSGASAYAGTIDLGGGSHQFGTAGFIVGHSGTLDWGTGAVEIVNGDLDCRGVGATVIGTADISMTGNSTVTWYATTAWQYSLTVGAGHTVVNASAGGVKDGALTVLGTLTANGTTYSFHGDIDVRATGVLNGTGAIRFYYALPGATFTIHPSATVSLSGGVYFENSQVGATILPAVAGGAVTLDCPLYFINIASTARGIAFGVGTYVVTGELKATISGAGDWQVDCSAGAVNLQIAGDVSRTGAGGGSLVWAKGTGTITADGAGAQDWDWRGLTIEDMVVAKSAGTLTFSGGFTADSFTATAGTLDFNGQTIATAGAFSIGPAAAIAGAADAMNAAAITVGGALSLVGTPGNLLTFHATAGWTLDVAGTAIARFVDVAYCDASGGNQVLAVGPSTDSNNNTNWLFAEFETGRRMQLGLGVAI